MGKSLLDDNKGAAEGGKVFALFQNLETQGAPLTWAWGGQVYTYEDGKVYEMSKEQVAHLNSLTVMTHKQDLDRDGQMRTVPLSQRHRFSVREVAAAEVAKIREDLGQKVVNQ
jgi:hypothetical protein